MSTVEKNKTEAAFDAVTAYMAANPESTVRMACSEVATAINSTPGAIAQAYYAQRAKNDGRPLRRRSRLSSQAARPMHEVLAGLSRAANELASAEEAFQHALEDTNTALHAHEEQLKARSESIDAREAQIARIESALTALQR